MCHSHAVLTHLHCTRFQSPDFPAISASIFACYLSFQLAMVHATCPGIPCCHSNHAHSCPYGKTATPPPPPGTPAQSVSTNSKKKTPDGIFPLASPLSGFSYLYVPRNSHSKQTTLQYVDEKPYLLACNLYIRSPLSGHSLIAVPPPSPQNRSLVIILYRPKTLSRLLTLLPSSTLCIILSILPSFHPPFPFPHSVFPSQQSCHTLT